MRVNKVFPSSKNLCLGRIRFCLYTVHYSFHESMYLYQPSKYSCKVSKTLPRNLSCLILTVCVAYFRCQARYSESAFFRRFRVCTSHVRLVEGEVSVMERCVHTESFSRLAEVYRCVETASRPRGSPAEVARWMFPQVCGGEGAEVTTIGVTLVGKIASCLVDQGSLLPEVASYFTELLKVLFDGMDLMSHLVSGLLSFTATPYVMC